MLIRIGIVDDHPVVSLGIAAVLNAQPDMHVTATAESVEGLYAFGQALDVILLDLNIGDGTTPAANVESLARGGARVLAFTAGDHLPLIREAVRAGAAGVVLKSRPGADVVDAVRRAAVGEEISDTHWAAAIEADPELADARLSDREREVLALYAAGATAGHVAELLFISTETVYDHVRRIRAKYAAVGRTASTKVDLFHRATEDGLLAGD